MTAHVFEFEDGRQRRYAQAKALSLRERVREARVRVVRRKIRILPSPGLRPPSPGRRGPLPALAGTCHRNCRYFLTSAKIRAGPPVPFSIFIGATMTKAPVGGMAPRLATFSRWYLPLP